MIDHTHIFSIGTIWDEYQLPRLTKNEFDVKALHKFNYLNIMESLIIDKTFYKELNKFIRKVKNIDKEYINKIMEDIPNDWCITEKEKKLLCNYILFRFIT